MSGRKGEAVGPRIGTRRSQNWNRSFIPISESQGAYRIPGERVKVGKMDKDRFDRSKRLGWYDEEKVRGARIAVIGCGAIGNEVAKDLVLSGFRNIALVDMDKVVGSNLNRCIFFTEKDEEEGTLKVEALKRGLLSLAPDARIEMHVSRIEELGDEFIPRFDVVLGCLDNIATRLHVNAHCKASGVPFIDGATDGMVGKVQMIGRDGPCLECNMNRSHMRILELRQSCTGEGVSFFEPRLAAEITTTSIVAAVQVREVLKLVHGFDDKGLKGVFYYDGLRNESSVLEIDQNPKCPHHSAKGQGTSNVREDVGVMTEEVEKVG